MKHFVAAAVAAVALMGPAVPAVAQDEGGYIDEVVVTGSRVRQWESSEIPQVTVPRRADNLIVAVRVVNDTREAGQRREELMQTLRAMARAAEGQADIALSIDNDGTLVPLTEDMVSTLTLGVDGNRSDTSAASLVVKTPIRPADTLDAASSRIERFVAATPKTGRSLVNVSGDWELSIINPNQYRGGVIAAIAADARTTSGAFGADYAVEITGMANPLTWRQSGPLDLALFIPYSMSVTPKP